MSPPLLSIIVPIGPGDTAWRALLPCLQPLPSRCELLLVAATPEDADLPVGAAHGCHRGASDRPLAADRPEGCAAGVDCGEDGTLRSQPCAAPTETQEGGRWLQAAAGRALQQNAGAAAARGALLWFLHCDSRPDARALDAAAQQDPAFDALGWFALAFHDGGWRHAWNAAGANLRARAGLPFGDQGLLLSARRFQALGGFDATLARGEDLDLVVRAHAAGLRLQRLPGTVATSARRYRAHGWIRTTARHLWLTLRLLHAARRRVGSVPRA